MMPGSTHNKYNTRKPKKKKLSRDYVPEPKLTDSENESFGGQSDHEMHDDEDSSQKPMNPELDNEQASPELDPERQSTPPPLDELLSPEAIGDGTEEERSAEFLSRLAAFTARIYRLDGKIRYCKICKKTYKSNYIFKTHMLTMHKKKKEFQCERCSKQYSMILQLKRHQRYYCLDGVKCRDCSKRFSDRGKLREHRKTHKIYKCDICRKSFLTNLLLLRHQKNHTCEKAIKCTFEGCKESFCSRNKRRLHIDMVHTEEKDYRHQCEICHGKFKTYVLMLSHMSEVHKVRKPQKPFLYICDQCGKEIKCRKSVKAHKRLHTTGRKVPKPPKATYPCQICKVEIKTKKNLKIHMGTEHNMAGNVHKCNFCNLLFTSLFALSAHLRNTHSVFKCLECKSEFGSKDERKNHRMTVHALEVKKTEGHPCKLCSMALRSTVELRNHMIFTHSVYKCGKCELEFGSRSARLLHMKKQHPPDVKPRICKYCSLEFPNSQRLGDHVKSMHIKSFKCSECDSTFKTSYDRIRHRRIEHAKPTMSDRVYKCSECTDVFQTLYEKRQHRKLFHPYIVSAAAETQQASGNFAEVSKTFLETDCRVCGRQCKTVWHLSEHMKTHSST